MRLVWQLAATLLLVGLVLHFVWWIIGAMAVGGAVWYGQRVYRASVAAAQRQAAADAAIASRADEQHNWIMQGNPRGMYGAAWLAVRRYQRL